MRVDVPSDNRWVLLLEQDSQDKELKASKGKHSSIDLSNDYRTRMNSWPSPLCQTKIEDLALVKANGEEDDDALEVGH